jgi:adenylate cyclase
MADQRVQRRLAAILAADVVGYSRLMGEDELGTLEHLMTVRRELLEPKIVEYGGRIVKTMGDGVLIEFPSAVNAVQHAVDVQKALATRNKDTLANRRIDLRIGINLGDIIVDGDDIYGDGVNVAARLEGLCAPSEVYVSGVVRDQVAGKTAVVFDDLGERSVKNIDKLVRVYRARAASDADSQSEFKPPNETSPARMKPSIAVLPFANMSGDPEQEYFADGMVDEIITSLSRLRWLYVAARTSSFEFKGRNQDIRDIARKLDVGYVLEGSVRKAEDRVRIIVQLIDAGTGAHIWADRFDGRLDDIFDLQDKITENVVRAIEPNVLSAEIARAKRKRPESLNAYEHYLKALPLLYENESSAEALHLLDKAIELDPTYGPAYAVAAHIHLYRVIEGKIEEAERGVRMARAALAADPDDPIVLSQAPFVLATLGRDLDAGIAAIERGVRFYPNVPQMLSQSGYVLTLVGDQETALERFKAALRLNPNNPLAYRVLTGASIACTLMGRFEDAVTFGEEARRQHGKWSVTFILLTAAYAHLGEPEKAATALAQYRELAPSATISRLKGQLSYRNLDQAERLWSGLRKAGLPE